MKTRLTVIALTFVSFFGCQVFAADDARTDKTRFQGLLRELTTVEAEYDNTIRQAMSEKKEGDQISLETKSKIVALGDKRDRIMDRLTIISLRHGWDIPDGKDGLDKSNIPDEKKRIFAPADEVIRERFTLQARKIAEGTTLPIITLDSHEEKTSKEKASNTSSKASIAVKK